MKSLIYKLLYIGFIFLGIYQALFIKDYLEAAASLGIGLAFDPFKQNQKWNDRPSWQNAILIFHLALVAVLFIIGISNHS